ncbi:hypothetical protein C802_01411 [Phocaeicola sartorii]|uniref:Uncharacterized protein n=1 Tax=Phocaeicola sartorii TaxID=671267 RepID=R9IHR3_9BACT|nr:hypothetical protein C802_01411 [Phocaeicola sartorii]
MGRRVFLRKASGVYGMFRIRMSFLGMVIKKNITASLILKEFMCFMAIVKSLTDDCHVFVFKRRTCQNAVRTLTRPLSF